MISNLKTQVQELFAELNRVDWPKKDKVVRYTWSVTILSVLVGLFLWGSDLGIARLLKFIIPTH
ncbi:MAG: preprotein translocase subunit SecE [Holophagaceae bacterium]|nr:preprotein translocase subunit SecE [Holophagaceae bacterium]